MCKKMQNNNNVELSKLLPSNICNKITDHNIYCGKCCNIFKKEQSLLRVKDLHEYDKFYLQLKFFLEHNKKPHPFSWQCSKTHYNQNMDVFFKDEELIERFGEGLRMLKSIERLQRNIGNCLYGLIIISTELRQYKKY